MTLWHLQAGSSGLIFVISAFGVILMISVFTHTILLALRHLPVKALILRQALKGLFRPRNATQKIVITLTAALALIFTIYRNRGQPRP
ncbi:MAG: hypothetical protein U5R30_18290 [Deltaproteobacteria bacterium]|nr:hypothetical protein [Deltaproteobacteria bacterium]